MSVAISLELLIEGDGEMETRLREECAWLQGNFRETDPEYHELIANLAMLKARHHWRLADDYRRYQREAAQRQAKRKLRSGASD